MYVKVCKNKKCCTTFTTKDKRRKYCNKNCYFLSLKGEGNHFSGKKHKKETVEKIKNKLRNKLSGDKNPFFGKHHNDDIKNIIKEKNRIFRNNNKDLILKRQLKRLNLTKHKISKIFDEYKNTHQTLSSLQDKYGVDKRVLKKYMIFFNICKEEELKQIAFEKKYKNATSAGEEILYILLCNLYGKERIKRQHNISNYYYDFIIDDKAIIEYDGYYWHKLIKNNDDIKNRLAKENGYSLYRVQENEKREVNFITEVEKIREFYEV